MNQEFNSAFFNENDDDQHLQSMFTSGMNMIDENLGLNTVKPDPGMDECWVGLETGAYGDQFGYGFMNQNTVLKMTDCSVTSFKKRKTDKGQTLQVVSEKEKKIIRCSKGDIKITNQNSNNKEASTNASSKDKSKVSKVQKCDYIHVRARRGQATDSHSLAERVRREKISERMKFLQDLVPGCNKITGKAGMLDEIINYVQSLQKQVEFLSMKLATISPELELNFHNIFMKEMFESPTTELEAHACSSATSAYFDQLNSLDQPVSYHGLETGVKSAEMGLRSSISYPISIHETFMDSSCFNQIQPIAMWDADLKNLYKMDFEQGTVIPIQSHQFSGSNEASNLKMEET